MITDAEFDAFLRETLSESQLTPEMVNVFYNYIQTCIARTQTIALQRTGLVITKAIAFSVVSDRLSTNGPSH